MTLDTEHAVSDRVAGQAAAHCGIMASGDSWSETTMTTTRHQPYLHQWRHRRMKLAARLGEEESAGAGPVACGWASGLKSMMTMRTTLTV